MDVSFSRWRRRKANENSVLTLAVQTEYMMQMVIEQVSPFSVFLVEKKNRRVWENRMSRTSGKDGFVITNATRFCNVHFQQSDIVRVPGGSHLCLTIGTLPIKSNQRPAGEQKKNESSNILCKSTESGSVYES